MKKRLAVGALVVVAVLLIASQALLPGIVEGRIEDRLTRGGGSAAVSIKARPALRLLAGDGSRIKVRGRGLRLELTPKRERIFDRLDGFGRVDVLLVDFRAGPFRTELFRLASSGSSPYSLQIRAAASLAELVRYGRTRLRGTVGGLLGGLAGDAFEKERRPIAFDLDLVVESEGGELRVRSGDATVAGVPADLIARPLATAIVSRL